MEAKNDTNCAGSEYYEANRSSIVQFLPASYDRVLEIGCASGGFSKYLVRASEIWGVEPFVPAAERARSSLTKVFIGTYDEVESQLPDGYFDLIVCNDVIEHMTDHDSFLMKIKKKAKPGAHLVGSLPNVIHITALIKLLIFRDFRYSDSGILDRTHLRFFTKRSIMRTFLTHDYSVELFSGLGSVIRHGLIGSGGVDKSVAGYLFRIFSAAVALFSFGFYWETQYPQFGFRVRFPQN